MALNSAQYEALFTNAFGASPAALGVELDNTGENVIGRAGPHTVELLVVQDRAIEWRLNGEPLFPWKQYAKDDSARRQNGEQLRSRLS